eukprot:IDg18907t1
MWSAWDESDGSRPVSVRMGSKGEPQFSARGVHSLPRRAGGRFGRRARSRERIAVE